jgi:putative restriction endonuclease
MDNLELLSRITNLTTWKRGGQRAPHKPLFLLFLLGQVLGKGRRNEFCFEEIEDDIKGLLREFGPSRSTLHPEHPFWHLNNSGLWILPDTLLAKIPAKKSPTSAQLKRESARGCLTNEFVSLIRTDSVFAESAICLLLDSHFPETMRRAILIAVGLEAFSLESKSPTMRDPRFRGNVLKAYGFRCAVCRSSIRLGDAIIGLEAAHIKWHSASGPPLVSNGLALCAGHHVLFDRGAFTLSDKHKLLVSDQVQVIDELSEQFLLRHHGCAVLIPDGHENQPDGDFVLWHREQVFQGEPRHV